MMKNKNALPRIASPDLGRLAGNALRMPRHFLLGLILIFALLAFEMFNFDTTRYALESLLGDVRFAGLAWATILAVAFCAIDFAGLARLFTPERGKDEPKEIWYLTGAWLLGATMNAVMTWWAVSTVLLSHELGNEVLSREQLLRVVPVFVAVLVWLTRILFIGAVTMAGERLLHGRGDAGIYRAQPAVTGNATGHGQTPTASRSYSRQHSSPNPASAGTQTQVQSRTTGNDRPAAPGKTTRVNRRPPRPKSHTVKRPGFGNVQASGRHRR
jgi:hypothetical protein